MTRLTRTLRLAALAAFLAAVAPAGARADSLITLSGSRYEGEVADQGNAYLLTQPNGAKMTFPKTLVREVIKGGTPAVAAPAPAPAPVAPPAIPAPPTPPASTTGKELSLDLGGGATMKLACIPPGAFMMGSPVSETDRSDDESRHRVTITKGFYMGRTEVTVAQFRVFTSDSGYKTLAEEDGWAQGFGGSADQVEGASWRRPGFPQDDDHPVVCIAWRDAVEFAKWLSKKSGRPVRLPTEAEWEYACRAGTATAYPWGESPDDGKGWANVSDQAAQRQFPSFKAFNWDDGYVYTSPVARFRPNAFGLYDMIGNAWEWTADYYADYPKTDLADPGGPPTGQTRVSRGGAWTTTPKGCRAAARFRSYGSLRYYYQGFRVAADEK